VEPVLLALIAAFQSVVATLAMAYVRVRLRAPIEPVDQPHVTL
jgi:ABC-type Fe3+ transport system permease subunit